jgi:hypothetical protein
MLNQYEIYPVNCPITPKELAMSLKSSQPKQTNTTSKQASKQASKQQSKTSRQEGGRGKGSDLTLRIFRELS